MTDLELLNAWIEANRDVPGAQEAYDAAVEVLNSL